MLLCLRAPVASRNMRAATPATTSQIRYKLRGISHQIQERLRSENKKPVQKDLAYIHLTFNSLISVAKNSDPMAGSHHVPEILHYRPKDLESNKKYFTCCECQRYKNVRSQDLGSQDLGSQDPVP